MGVKERRERERQRRRKEILRAAQKEFFKNGFSGASMEKIAARCQLAKGTLYLYFKNKEDLYVSLIEDGFKIISAMMKAEIGASQGIEEKLVAMARTYYRFSIEHNEYFSIFHSLNAGDMHNIHEKVDQAKMERLKRMEHRDFEHSVALLKQGIQSGLFRKDLDPYYSMRIIWASISGAMMHCKQSEEYDFLGHIDQEKLAEDIVRSLIVSFKAGSSPETAKDQRS